MNNRKSSNVKTKNDDAPARGVRLAEDENLTTIKISNKSTTKGVAGAIAHLARDNRAVDVLAGSASALNVAVKATAVARVYLNADAPDCGLAASMSMNDGRKNVALKLVIFDVKHMDSDETPDNATLTVASKTDSGALAGAIAARVREGKPVKLSAVGAGSVLRAVTSVALATRYVSENFPNGLAILPTFEKTGGEDPSAGASISILKLIVKPIA